VDFTPPLDEFLHSMHEKFFLEKKSKRETFFILPSEGKFCTLRMKNLFQKKISKREMSSKGGKIIKFHALIFFSKKFFTHRVQLHPLL
jgi:hypothetical protein